MPNFSMFLDNVNSGEDGCSDIEDDCITTFGDSLLDDSVIPTPAQQTSGKRGREDDHPIPVVENTHRVPGSNPQTPPATPGPSSSQSGSALTLTCNDGTVFQMADFMKVVMEQMKIHMTGTMTNPMSVDLDGG